MEIEKESTKNNEPSNDISSNSKEVTNQQIQQPSSTESDQKMVENEQLNKIDENVVTQFHPGQSNKKKKMTKAEKQEAKDKRRMETKKKKRVLEKERKKQRRADMKAQGIPLPKKQKKLDPSEQEPSFGTIILDCGWDSAMTPKEIGSLMKQIEFSRCANRKTKKNFKLFATSVDGQLADRLAKTVAVQNWNDIQIEKKPYEEIFDKKSLVYLSSDSSNTISTLDPNKAYIIGALVDHNRLKGVTFEKAQKQGIETAKLPIGEHVELNSRAVISVNQVVEMLVDFLNTNDWGQSVEKIIPKRKIKGALSKNERQAKKLERREERKKNNENSTTTTTTTNSDNVNHDGKLENNNDQKERENEESESENESENDQEDDEEEEEEEEGDA